MTPAELDLLLARLLQHVVTVEGIDANTFDVCQHGELLRAALCYFATAERFPAFVGVPVPRSWPFDLDQWRPTDRRGNLLHAAVFCTLELERRERAKMPHKAVMRILDRVTLALTEL